MDFISVYSKLVFFLSSCILMKPALQTYGRGLSFSRSALASFLRCIRLKMPSSILRAALCMRASSCSEAFVILNLRAMTSLISNCSRRSLRASRQPINPFMNFWMVPAICLCFCNRRRVIMPCRKAATLPRFFSSCYSCVSCSSSASTSPKSRAVGAPSPISSSSRTVGNSSGSFFFFFSVEAPLKYFSSCASLLSMSP